MRDGHTKKTTRDPQTIRVGSSLSIIRIEISQSDTILPWLKPPRGSWYLCYKSNSDHARQALVLANDVLTRL